MNGGYCVDDVRENRRGRPIYNSMVKLLMGELEQDAYLWTARVEAVMNVWVRWGRVLNGVG